MSQGLGPVGLERQGLTGCQGPNVGGVTPAGNLADDTRFDPMQVLRLRQALGEQVNQVRGVPELFGQRGDGMFPYGIDPMHVLGSSGEYSMDVFSKSEKWEAHQFQTLASGRRENWKLADICQRSHCMGHAGVFRIRSRNRTNRTSTKIGNSRKP